MKVFARPGRYDASCADRSASPGAGIPMLRDNIDRPIFEAIRALGRATRDEIVASKLTPWRGEKTIQTGLSRLMKMGLIAGERNIEGQVHCPWHYTVRRDAEYPEPPVVIDETPDPIETPVQIHATGCVPMSLLALTGLAGLVKQMGVNTDAT